MTHYSMLCDISGLGLVLFVFLHFWLDTHLPDVFVVMYRCHDFVKLFGPRTVIICDQVLLYVNYRPPSLNFQFL